MSVQLVDNRAVVRDVRVMVLALAWQTLTKCDKAKRADLHGDTCATIWDHFMQSQLKTVQWMHLSEV